MPSVDDIRRCALIHLVEQCRIRLDNIHDDVGDVILAPLRPVHFHRRPHCWRRDCENLANHPIRTRKHRAKSHKLYIFIADSAEYFDDDFRCQFHGKRPILIRLGRTPRNHPRRRLFEHPLDVVPFRVNLPEARLHCNALWLETTAARLGIFTATLNLAGDAEYMRPSLIGRHRHQLFIRGFADAQRTTFDTNATQDFKHRS